MSLALSALTGDPQRFFSEIWTKRWSVHRASRPAPLCALFDPAEVDRLLDSGLRAPALRMMRAGTPVPPAQYLTSHRVGGHTVRDAIRADRVRSLFASGATLVLQALHRSHAPVRAVCQALEASIGHPVQANAYVSPPDAQGLPAHHDTHDVFALQTHGKKEWRLFAPQVEHPVPGMAVPCRHENPGDAVTELSLEAGSCLYLPRGIPHAASSSSELSIHVTFGIQSPTWLDVFERLVATAREDARFREALPLRYAEHPEGFESEIASRLGQWARWLESRSPEEIARTELARRSAPSVEPWSIRELAGHAELPDETRLVVCSGLEPRFQDGDERCVVQLEDRELRFPITVASAVRIAFRPEGFSVSELAPHLDRDGRVVLCRRLLAEGLLERA